MEPFFILSYYAGIDWNTYLNWPVSYKRWYIQRMNDEIKRAQDGGNQDPTSVVKAPHMNQPDVRKMTGKVKPFTNPKTWRPT